MNAPHYSTAQRDALTPAPGMRIWNSDLSRSEVWSGSAWIPSMSDPETVKTPDAAPTPSVLASLAEGTVFPLEAKVTVASADGAVAGLFVLQGVFRREVGQPTVQVGGTNVVVGRTDVTLDAVFDVSSPDVRIVVTGLAATNLTWEIYTDQLWLIGN